MDPITGANSATIWAKTTNESSSLVLNVPPGTLGDTSLTDFPWGVQLSGSCNLGYNVTYLNVNTCSWGDVQFTSTITNSSAGNLRFSIDAVSLTPFSPAPEPSSMLICGLGLIGVVVGLAARQRRSNVA